MKLQLASRNNEPVNKDISQILADIHDPECQLKARELLKVFKRNLELLRRGYLLLNENDYRSEVAKALNKTTQTLKIVATLDAESALESSGELLALANGVKITRIFITDQQHLLNPMTLKKLFKRHQAGIDVQICFLTDLPAVNPTTPHSTPYFAIYNDTLVTDQTFDSLHYFGKKTTNSNEVKKYRQLFELIQTHSQAFASERIQSQLQLINTLPI